MEQVEPSYAENVRERQRESEQERKWLAASKLQSCLFHFVRQNFIAYTYGYYNQRLEPNNQLNSANDSVWHSLHSLCER